jgi:MYXO-CTERM domain-containing protein
LAISGIGLPGIFTTPNPGNLGAPTFGPADVTFDNFRVVPAPGSTAVLALAGLLARRRRR